VITKELIAGSDQEDSMAPERSIRSLQPLRFRDDAGFRAKGILPNLSFLLIDDTDLTVAKLYDMLPAVEPGTAEIRTAGDNATVCSVFIIGPDKRIKLMLTYPMSIGRNFDEILRAIDAMQLNARHNGNGASQLEKRR
jgi:alkyl hydroperoxide reductase subunit AhpC